MNKQARFLGIALVGVVALMLPLNADATCGSAISFGSYYSFVTGSTNGPSLRSNFWTLNNGNPATGAGVDNGLIVETGKWLIPYGPGPNTFAVLSTWAAEPYDGCPDTAGLPLPPEQRMILAFSDVDAEGNMTYAVACSDRDVQAGTQFDFTQPGNAPLALVQAPRAVIANTVRAGNEAVITIAPPNFSAGFYSDGSTNCNPATIIPQFDVYKQTTGRGVTPSNTTDAGPVWALVATCNSSGTPACAVTTTCGATNCDNYLAVVPHYNSNFTTAEAATGAPARVGVKSSNVQAGPILAVTPKPKKINNERVGPKQME